MKWAALIVWVLTALGGLGLLALWLQRRPGGTAAAHPVGSMATAGAPLTAIAEGSLPAEQHFPLAVVAGHGVAAATTLILVLLAALQVGG